ncbi:MAG TPA: hypothetical protein VG294_05230 [Solirubrobacteraceae bacterium]|jgi:hypothetical protein|nr:hypothetical protein [Solirubrobacteraceae bacterium]
MAQADPVSGAIFTTLPNGSEVNFNIYSSKLDVYLNGGPGPGAPSTAAGLPDGSYVFQVTDPSGKTLLSTDLASCRQFTVSGGQINGVVSSTCSHLTGVSVDHGSTTVQLMPYNDTPNPGGVYKVWATSLANYLQGCASLGVPNGLAVVDCGSKAGTAVHGFIPSDSKTDNFKVGQVVPQEIDTRYFDSSGNVLDGLGITWTDPSGATNQKWSYYAPSLQIFHEAHVEDVSQGINLITVSNQPGCTVGEVDVLGSVYGHGPMTVPIKVTGTSKSFTYRVDVHCL